jgi:hypothetical protein
MVQGREGDVSESGGTFVFEDADAGVRFTVDGRFVPGPKAAPSADLGLDLVRSAYLAFTDEEGRQYVLSVSSLPVEHGPTREELEDLAARQNGYNAALAAERGWTVHEVGRVATLGGTLARYNEFVTPGTHPDDRETVAGDEDASSHVQAWTVFPPGRAVSLMLGVHPPGDLDEARAIMKTVTGTIGFSGEDDEGDTT